MQARCKVVGERVSEQASRWGAPAPQVRVFGLVWRFALATLLLACFFLPATAATYTGRVIAISDGDTLTVLDADRQQHKIRLEGIDAPEKRQPWGQRARQSLGELVFDRMVEIQVGKTDRYGRTIGRVFVDGRDVSLEQVRRGLAWHYKAYAREQTPQARVDYAQAEREARSRRLGLWGDDGPVAPWDFRKGRRPSPGRVHARAGRRPACRVRRPSASSSPTASQIGT